MMGSGNKRPELRFRSMLLVAVKGRIVLHCTSTTKAEEEMKL
jgi:hypothetical protein